MKKLICTILLGTALVGSNVWAATTTDMGAESVSASETTTGMSGVSAPRPLTRADIKALIEKDPPPKFSITMDPHSSDMIRRIENIDAIISKVSAQMDAEGRNEPNADEIKYLYDQYWRFYEEAKPTFIYIEDAKKKYDSDYKKWEEEHQNIVKLAREAKLPPVLRYYIK